MTNIALILDGHLVCPFCKGKSRDVFTFIETVSECRSVGDLIPDGKLQVSLSATRTDYDYQDFDPHLLCRKCKERIEIPTDIDTDFDNKFFAQASEVGAA